MSTSTAPRRMSDLLREAEAMGYTQIANELYADDSLTFEEFLAAPTPQPVCAMGAVLHRAWNDLVARGEHHHIAYNGWGWISMSALLEYGAGFDASTKGGVDLWKDIIRWNNKDGLTFGEIADKLQALGQ